MFLFTYSLWYSLLALVVDRLVHREWMDVLVEVSLSSMDPLSANFIN